MESHYSQNQPQTNTGKAPMQIGGLAVFNQSAHFAYIYKKTEKLVTAVYMITNFIKDDEPLKWRIRERALELMSLNLSFNTVSLADRRDLLKKYQAYSLEIVSLSSIAQHSGLMSEMNFNILSREFNGLVEIIEKDENRKANEETVVLNPNFFDMPRTDTPKIENNLIESREKTIETSVVQNTTSTPKENVFYKGHVNQPLKDTVKKPENKDPKDTKDDRQAVIIKLLSKKSGLNVKDFTTAIKGVSDKTIQRELLSMVAKGTIKKEGERRWSTYSLA